MTMGRASSLNIAAPSRSGVSRCADEYVVVSRAASVGRVSAELVAPYPPGVPVLVTGEEITRASLEALEQSLRSGNRIAYAADPTLATLHVVTG